MAINELWRKQVGHLLIRAFEQVGVITIRAEMRYYAQQSYTQQEADAADFDLEEHVQRRVVRRVQEAIDLAYAEIHS